MNHAVARDLKKSTNDFVTVVWPIIGKIWFGDGELIPVESVTQAPFAKTLDVEAGVDVWIKRAGADGKTVGITPAAQRIQWPPNDIAWDTFTIRSSRQSGVDTELQKRRRAIEQSHKGYLYPHVTIQAYLSLKDSRALSIGAIRTTELYEHWQKYRVRSNSDLQSEFLYARWCDLLGLGCKVLIWHPPKALGDLFNEHEESNFA